MDPTPPALVPPTGADSPDTRLPGPWLVVVRMAWVLLFLLNLVWFALALVAQVSAVQHPCVDPNCLVTPAQAASLRHLGIGLGTFAVYYAGIPALTVLAGSILAVLLFWRRSDDWLALAVGLFLLYPVSSFASGPNSPDLLELILPLAFANTVIYYGMFLIFPDGRFVPRWAWLLLVAWVGWHVVIVIQALQGFQSPLWGDFPYPILYLSALAIQVYRYRRVSNARQRQQTKWVVLGVAVALLANILYWIVLPIAIPAFQQPDSLYSMAAYPLYELATIALPISFALAIQRHQLFDVDVLINRALAYGTLTAILAGVYFGVVIGVQAVVGRVNHQASQSPVIVVASTLLIAALFTPLRRGLQAIIDRRFYRRKYNAARTLEAFGETLRTETDLSELSEHLVDVVRETMQPATISLWLAASGRPGGNPSARENDDRS